MLFLLPFLALIYFLSASFPAYSFLLFRVSSAAVGGGVHKKNNINSIPGVRTACVASSSRAAYPSPLQANKSSLKRKHTFTIAGEPGKIAKAAKSIDVRKVVKFSNNVHTFPTVLGKKRSSIGELKLKRHIKKPKPLPTKPHVVESGKKKLLSLSQQRREAVKNVYENSAIIDVQPLSKTPSFSQRKKGGSSIERKAAGSDQPPRRKLKKQRIKSVGYYRAQPRLAYSIQPNRATRLTVGKDTGRGILNKIALNSYPKIKSKRNG